MAKIVILGSSNAVPDENHENTHLAVVGQKYSVLIDCVSNPIVRIQQAGLSLDRLDNVILTHFHPDHVSGVPLLLMNMWLLGRKTALHIYGLDHTLDRVEDLMNLYDWSGWPNFFQVIFHRLPQEEMTPVLSNEEFRILASPVRHLIPTIGLRIEFVESGKTAAYSCDTEPCPQVTRLAEGVDVLIHEATGASPGHSSAGQAAGIARQAEVESLYLIHDPTRQVDQKTLIKEAEDVFLGKIVLAEDFMELAF